MEPLRFVHTADLHLDSPFEGVGAVSEEVATHLREATFQAFGSIVDLCLAEEVDFLLVAGDVYDAADRSLRAQVRFRDQLARLAGAGIPSFVVHGNHDPLDGWGASLDWPDLVYHFPAHEVQSRSVLRQGREIARIYGISYPQREVRDNYARLFHWESDAPYAVALLHANIDGDPAHDNYAPASLGDLVASGFDYWALGHVHTPRILHGEDAAPWVVYPGNPQGRSPRETGPRGCYLVEVDPAGRTSLSFRPVHAVEWLVREVPIDGLEREQDLLERLESELQAAAGGAAETPLMVRLMLTGRGPLHSTLRRAGQAEGLLLHLQERAVGRSFTWPESIRLATRSAVNRENLRSEGSLTGDFLRLAEEVRRDPALEAELRSALEPLWGNRVGQSILDEPDAGQFLALLEQAESLGLDHLIGEEE